MLMLKTNNFIKSCFLDLKIVLTILTARLVEMQGYLCLVRGIFDVYYKSMKKTITLLSLGLVLFSFSSKKEIGVEFGTASYYHNKFNGRKTSSGERFSNDSLTAAHKTLPLGTFVMVTNLKNDSVVYVKINDRLPYKSKRSIDLSVKAAKQLNFIKAGLTKVRIEVLPSIKG